jgi:hypothetical protein
METMNRAKHNGIKKGNAPMAQQDTKNRRQKD